MNKNKKDRFRLLIYEQMWKRWALPCILVIPASIALWWFAPQIPIVSNRFRILILLIPLIVLAIFLYAFWAKHMAFVSLRPKNFRIQTPFYPLFVSYGRVKSTRPGPLPEEYRNQWLADYTGKTVLLVDLTEYPLSRTWLRLWMSPYLLTPEDDGFIFVVNDWMALSRRFDHYRQLWEDRLAEKQREVAERQPF